MTESMPTNITKAHDELTVQDCFARLTQTWVELSEDSETGAVVSRERPALLLELREEIFGGMEGTGGAASFGSKLPISAGALDLYQAIDGEISEAWAHAFPNQVPTIDEPERLLSQVVAVTSAGEVVTVMVPTQRVDHRGQLDEHWWVERVPTEFTVEAIMRRWVRQIVELFDPPRTREIKGPCIQCDTEWGWKSADGELRPHRVFVFVQNSSGTTTEARCLSCGASWGPSQFRFIAAHLAPGSERPSISSVAADWSTTTITNCQE